MVSYLYKNPITNSQRASNTTLEAESDPMDNPIGLTAPEPDSTQEGVSDLIIPKFADALNLSSGCTIDGMPSSCELANSLLENGAGEEYVPYSIVGTGQKPNYIDPPMPDIPSPDGSPTTALAFGSSSTYSAQSSRSQTKKPHCPSGTKARKDAAGNWQCVGTGVSKVVVKASTGKQSSTVTEGPKIGKDVPVNLRSLVSELAIRPDCATILAQLADKLSAFDTILPTESGKTFVETVFDSLKQIKIDPNNAGSGASTADRKIYLGSKPAGNETFVNNFFAKYTIQELVHNFRSKGKFDDSTIDKAALALLREIDPAKAQREAASRKEDGFNVGDIAHHLVNKSCQYTQKEVDNNGQTK